MDTFLMILDTKIEALQGEFNKRKDSLEKRILAEWYNIQSVYQDAVELSLM